MLPLGTHAYARVIHTNFVFFSFTSFTHQSSSQNYPNLVKDSVK